MNPLVEEMLTAKNRQDLEIAMLEDLLTGDVKCEAKNHGNYKCAKEVTHKFTCCAYSQNVCGTRVDYLKGYYLFADICSRCSSRCWTITSI